MDMPPAVPHLHRQLILAGEILKIPGMASSVQKAIKLGGELGKLLDEAQRHDIELKNIDRLVPDAFKGQWSKTEDFLKIITETWPQKLQEMGCIDPEERQDAAIRIRVAHWQQSSSTRPVIAVGFDNDAPALMDLLKAVAGSPRGSVVLQGLDTGLDPQSWDVLTPVHPQYALKKILEGLGADRAVVQEWKADGLAAGRFARAPKPEDAAAERQKLLRETMRPSGTVDGWKHLKKTARKNGGIDPQALNGMDLITCTSPQEEASVIALKMRESLEIPGRTTVLVTPDRSLARRVSARLRNWQISVKDEAGGALPETPVGIYLLSLAEMAAEEWAPVPMLEALKHPLTALGEDKASFRQKVSDLEDAVFHGPRPSPGAQGVRGALTAAFNRAAPRQKPAPDLKRLETFTDNIEKAGKNFFDRMASPSPVPFSELLDEHIRCAEAFAQSDKETGADRIWRGDDGVRATRFLTGLRDVAHLLPPMTGRDYVDVLHGLMQDVAVKISTASHPALRITSPERARLQKSDIVILGGVNDGIWPQPAHENPWLSPDMIKALGLPAAEEDIGRAAHRFVQLASNPNVLLTRAMRSGDAPTVASPFLTRLMMVLKGAGLDGMIEEKTRLLDIHTAMHTPAQPVPIDPPAPTPDVDKRPKQLPVTAVEMLMRDPYAVYVRYVLKLRPKDPLDASPSASERGIFTHAALEAFVRKYPGKMPDNAEEELLKIGQDTFRERMDNPSVRAFWWPRFERIAKWFVTFEAERREASKVLGSEVRGKLEIDTGDGVFTLTTIADRLDRDLNDQLTIIDYKTGSVPSQKSVALGFSPQLTLEALIAFTGGFDGIDAADVGELQYWKLSGGRPAGEVTEVKGDVKKLVGEARQGIEALIRAFNDKATPYLASPRPEWAPRYNNSKHLSRVDEWSRVRKTGAPPKKASPAAKGRKK
jgi:ATP-dependent helicase/nuclease subunit B